VVNKTIVINPKITQCWLKNIKFQLTFNIKWIKKRSLFFELFSSVKSFPRYMEKQIIMKVQAMPKTIPGGVQGAWFKLVYQLEAGPLFMSQLPMAKPLKFTTRNKSVNFSCFTYSFVFKASISFKISSASLYFESLSVLLID
jgi:hypothetical protein